jgi:O-antigen/teichoic acid export membrane protein
MSSSPGMADIVEIERRIFVNASLLTASGLVSQLANFGFVVYLARACEPAVFGEYSFALSLGALMAIAVSFGTGGLLFREISLNPGLCRHMTGVLFPAQAILAALVWAFIIASFWMMNVDPVNLRIIALVTAFQLMVPLTALFSSGFMATERMIYGAAMEVGMRTTILVIGCATIQAGARVELTLAVLPISALVAMAIIARLSMVHFGVPDFHVDLNEVRRIARRALPFLGIAALTVIYSRAGIIILRVLGSSGDVGLYASAERLVMAAGIVQVTFVSAMYPSVVRLWSTDPERFAELVSRGARIILMTALPFATVLYLFADDLVGFLYGKDYADASIILKAVAWLLVLRGVSSTIFSIGTARNQQYSVLIAKSTGVFFLIGICALLVPSYGPLGLAVAAISAEAITFGLGFLRLRDSGFLPPLLRPAIRTGAACVIACAAVMMMGVEMVWLRLAVLAVAGLGSLWMLRAVQWNDVRFLINIIWPRRQAKDANSLRCKQTQPLPTKSLRR